ncbi:ATP-binding cassette domain-containing protein [Actinomadura sp. GTD37]|uniref:ATP-binding cassette domain-containing protein n=1 Tax=Actinomadura sp. GTD37 TaxID=1778030 RepID=UPI0035BF7EDF
MTPEHKTPGTAAAAGGTAAAVSGPGRAGSGTGGGRPRAEAPPRAPGLDVRARGLGVRGARGWAFRNVDLTVPGGALVAVSGIAGTGRTALLLTLGGRMKPTEGTVAVGGLTGLAHVQRAAALGVVPGVTELDPALTVREHLNEALALREGVFGGFRGREARRRRALERVGLDLDPRTLAEELAPDEAQLLGAALALVGGPGLLLLDDVDEGLDAGRQRGLWRRLAGLAADGVTVVAACHDATPAEGLATHSLPL